MAVTKEQKAETLSEVSKLFQGAQIVVLSENRGINVEDMTRLRRNVREAKGLYKVVKNTLSRKVFAEDKYEGLRKHLRGPIGLAFGSDEPIELLKKLTEFAKANDKFQVRAGLLDGQILQKDELTTLASLPSKPVLLAQIMGLLNSPVQGLLGVFNANIRNFLYLLKGIEEKAAGAAGGEEKPAS